MDQVCEIFKRSKRQIFNYRLQGLPDYGGHPVMFDPNEVRQFIFKRRQQKGLTAASKETADEHRRNMIVQNMLDSMKFKKQKRKIG